MNGIMKLTFSNMTLETNILHMRKQLFVQKEEIEVFSVNTLIQEHDDFLLESKIDETYVRFKVLSSDMR